MSDSRETKDFKTLGHTLIKWHLKDRQARSRLEGDNVLWTRRAKAFLSDKMQDWMLVGRRA